MQQSLTGTWGNKFGSTMSLYAQDERIIGIYSSHTGSTGEYLLVGNCSNNSPSDQLGQSVAFSIYWRNILPGEADPSWHWSGSMCGQLQINGSMVLTNSIVVSVPFETYQKSNYIDELEFTRSKELSQPQKEAINKHFLSHQTSGKDTPTLPTRLTGTWDNNPMQTSIKILPANALSGLTKAILTISGNEIELLGFTDIDANDSEAQSFSLAGYNQKTSQTLSLSGQLEAGSDALMIYSWASQPTAPENSFMQTNLASINLTRK
ncbi:avidin/streptavidin family protein [Motilimonas cestriensis]|uniref:Avidin/streptavidin family protein n=1 Tax=Motilimonas cestriensis TaxID=2742685 RepID=A0ABS8WBL0_9GAMM|nr:avidin/streptavidin family protein [Motilimonas cestriensis]MCE2594785.1 avidin/streptavidin family protein [Motilimonas cestriensis]